MILRCHATGCRQQRSERLPMCKRHWLMVPRQTKGTVLLWREGSDAWLAAVEIAAVEIAARERRAA